MKIGLPTLGALVATFILASISSTPADARTICKGSGTNAQCYTVKTKKKFAKRAKAARYAQRARTKVAAFAQPGSIGMTIRGTVGVRHSISMACGMPEGTVLAPLPPTTTLRAVSIPRHFGSCRIARVASTHCQIAAPVHC